MRRIDELRVTGLAPVATPGAGGTAGGGNTWYVVSPVVVGGAVYLGVILGREHDGAPGTITYTLDTVDGRRLWQIPDVGGTPVRVVGQDGGVVLLSDGPEIAGMLRAGGGLIAVRLANGAVLWQQGGARGHVTYGDGHLYLSHDGLIAVCIPRENHAPDLQAMDATNGHLLWTHTFTAATAS